MTHYSLQQFENPSPRDLLIVRFEIFQLLIDYTNAFDFLQNDLLNIYFFYFFQISGLFGGWIMDKFGRRRTLMVGSVLFGSSSVLMGVAQGKPLLLAGRVITGFGIGKKLYFFFFFYGP